MLLGSACAFAQSDKPIKGDVNGDGMVDVADITAVIEIIKNMQEHYFYLGTIRPTLENFKVIPGTTTSYTSLDEVNGTTVSVSAGQTLYMLCPTSWMMEKSVTILDKLGHVVTFTDEIDNTTITGYSIYKTQPWNTSSEATLKLMTFTNPVVDIKLGAWWKYDSHGVAYDWSEDWIFGWDEEDKRYSGEIGYTEPATFEIRNYFTQNTPYGPHTYTTNNTIEGNTARTELDFGFWDILAWSTNASSDIPTLIIDESLDHVTAYTSRASGNNTYWQPDQLFAAYIQAVEINEQLDGFVYDAGRNLYIKNVHLGLEPLTYIYLTQVILHNNNNKIIGVDGSSRLSGMARTTDVNTGVAGDEAVSVTYNVRYKHNLKTPRGETVDVAGGRVMTFGIPGQNGNRISREDEVTDTVRHYIELNVLFNNGLDSTLVFDVTDQVRKHWKGGVITVDVDMDTIPVPERP